MELRPYQTAAIDAVEQSWASDRADALGVAATGAGKTVILLALLLRQFAVRPDARGVIVAHREELIHQPVERLRAIAGDDWLMAPGLARPRVGLLMGGSKQYGAQLTIATVQTLSRSAHLNKLLAHGPIDYLIIDEAHHAVAPAYLKVIDGLKQDNPALRHLGVTATPMRGDNLAMANVYPHNAFTITIADLVRAGYLVQPRWLAISTNIDLTGVKSRGGDFQQGQLAERFDTAACRALVIAAHKEYAPERPAIAFTTSVAGAHDLAQAFREAGFTAASADGTTDKSERRQILADFRAGKFQVLCNCGLWTEGLDVPEIAAIHLARPTRSDGLYLQMVGRGLRPVPGKDDCIIFDYLPADARNVAMLGDILGCPIPRDELLKQFKKSDEPGATQIGFTFDGDTFDADGLDLQVVARELRYLEQSPFVWYRREGMLTLGCGRGSDGNDRILAIVDGQLWTIGRRNVQQEDGQWQPAGNWVARPWDCDDPFAEGERLASRHAVSSLAAKDRGWQARAVSQAQGAYLKRLARGSFKQRAIDALTAGEASNLINWYQAKFAIDRYRAAQELQEVA